MSRAASALLLTLVSYGAGSAETLDPMTRAVVPADGGLSITDYGFRNWGPELVQYTVDTARFQPGQCALLNDQGQPVPCQIDDDADRRCPRREVIGR